MAAQEGLESLTIGEVAKRLGLSKSGVFSRVGSREALQIAVIQEYDRRLLQDVFVPAMREPHGLPRLKAIMRLWLGRRPDGGSLNRWIHHARGLPIHLRGRPPRRLAAAPPVAHAAAQQPGLRTGVTR